MASILSGAAVLFDLDGTLVDTAPDLAGTMNDIMAKLSLPPIPIEEVRHLVGRGARVLIEEALKFHGRPVEGPAFDQMFRAFLDIYATRIALQSRPFPAAQMVLDLLMANRTLLGIVTNKPEGLTRLLLDGLGLAERFDVVVGFETAARPKPFADPILFAVERLKVPLHRTLMVGDSATDVGAARAAGVKVIAMRHGYSDVPADELGADAVIDGFAELTATAEALLAPS